MGLVTSALQIGKSALLAYQGGLQVIGNNIANVGTDGYSRQSPSLVPQTGAYINDGYHPGGGVTLAEVRRNVDEALNVRLRMAMGDEQEALAEHNTLARLESLFNALSDVDLSSQLNDFFNAWADLQNTPEEASTRNLVLSQGTALAESLQRMSGSLENQYEALNGQVEQTVTRINEIASDVAELNLRIATSEVSGQSTVTMLRDQRDRLLAELSELVAIQTREQPDGGCNVYVGNELLVQRELVRELTTSMEIVDGRQAAVLRWDDNGGQAAIWGGELEGLLRARDTHIVEQINNLDQLAQVLIGDINRIHAAGQGLEGYERLTGSYNLSDPTLALNADGNGMVYLPENGGFLVTVTNGTTGLQETTRIEVDLDGVGTDTTLNALAAEITARVANLTASVTTDNRLQLEAGSGYAFTFSEDSSGALGALGVNTFFSGRDASTVGLDDNIVGQPQRLAAAVSGLPGDGTNAGEIAGLASSASRSLNNGQSVMDYYNGVMAELASTSSAAENAVEASDVISRSLQAQWEATSGVSLDEETLQLMRYQRAFQGAARVVTVVDELIQQLLVMTR